MNLEQAIEALDEGIDTIIIPCFLVTDRQTFINEVIRRCKQVLKHPKEQRIYLFLQEGLSKRQGERIWDDIYITDASLNSHKNSKYLSVYSFGNVPTSLIHAFIEDAPKIEWVDPEEGDKNAKSVEKC